MTQADKRCKNCETVKGSEDFYVMRKGTYEYLDSYCKPCRLEYNRNRSAYNATTQRNGRLKSVYGISVDEYQAMLDAQNGKCAICDSDNNGKTLNVDHDHETGVVRALLCHGCNTALGLLGDDVNRCLSAAAYLMRHQGAMV